MGGGIALSLGNLSMQYAWAFVGLCVTEVISSSMIVVIATSLNYFLDDRINKAEILFPGVASFFVVVCLGDSPGNQYRQNGISTIKAVAGTAEYILQHENQRAIKVLGKGAYIGLAICFFRGFWFSIFSPDINLATNDQWHKLKPGVPHLSVYIVFFYFSISCFVVAISLNIAFFYYPVLNLTKSSIKSYLSNWTGREWVLVAGLLCGFGNGLQFMGGEAAGYAAADCVQALPLVSTFWGILLFGEYRRSSRRTYLLLACF